MRNYKRSFKSLLLKKQIIRKFEKSFLFSHNLQLLICKYELCFLGLFIFTDQKFFYKGLRLLKAFNSIQYFVLTNSIISVLKLKLLNFYCFTNSLMIVVKTIEEFFEIEKLFYTKLGAIYCYFIQKKNIILIEELLLKFDNFFRLFINYCQLWLTVKYMFICLFKIILKEFKN